MTRPILDIFADVEAGVIAPEIGNHLHRGEQRYLQLMEKNAPGYIALEKAGKGDEYDYSKFREPGTQKGEIVAYHKLLEDSHMLICYSSEQVGI
jgi:hypothetical protein